MGQERKKRAGSGTAKRGRVTPKGGRHAGRLSETEKAELDEIFDGFLLAAGRDLADDPTPFDAQAWASHLCATWSRAELVGMDAQAVLAGGLIARAAERGTANSMIVLRALASVAPEPYRTNAGRAADNLAAAGSPDPVWSAVVGRCEPIGAWLSYDDADDDGCSVLVGFDGPAGADTLGVYVDHNLGGLAKDAFAVPAPVDQVVERLRTETPFAGVRFRSMRLAEAAARWRRALEVTDMAFEAPVDPDLHDLRALIATRLDKLPAVDTAVVDESDRFDEDQRDQLLIDFMESDESIGLWTIDDEVDEESTVAFLAAQAMTFSLDYVAGTPLRFSPTMVEIFCLDWAPRKIAADEDAFTLLPDVLAAWIRFAGRRRGIPEECIAEAVHAAYEYAPEMIERSGDFGTWGPAKTMALAIEDRGIDPTDAAEVDEFVAEVNREGGIDVLAQRLARSRPRRS